RLVAAAQRDLGVRPDQPAQAAGGVSPAHLAQDLPRPIEQAPAEHARAHRGRAQSRRPRAGQPARDGPGRRRQRDAAAEPRVSDAVLVERTLPDGHLVHLVLNRPEALNAIDNRLARDLIAVCQALATDPSVWVVIL